MKKLYQLKIRDGNLVLLQWDILRETPKTIMYKLNNGECSLRKSKIDVWSYDSVYTLNVSRGIRAFKKYYRGRINIYKDCIERCKYSIEKLDKWEEKYNEKKENTDGKSTNAKHRR